MDKIKVVENFGIEEAIERFHNKAAPENIPLLVGIRSDLRTNTKLLAVVSKVHYVDSENPTMYLEVEEGTLSGYDATGFPIYENAKPIEFFDFSEDGYEKACSKLFQLLLNPNKITYSKLTYEQQKIKRPDLSEKDYLFLLGLADKLGEVVDRIEDEDDFYRTVKGLDIGFDLHEVAQAVYDNIHDIPF